MFGISGYLVLLFWFCLFGFVVCWWVWLCCVGFDWLFVCGGLFDGLVGWFWGGLLVGFALGVFFMGIGFVIVLFVMVGFVVCLNAFGF